MARIFVVGWGVVRREGLGVGCLPSSPGGAAGRRHAQQVVHCGATTRWCVPGGAFTSPDGRQMPVVTVCAVQGRQGCHPGMRLELPNRAGTRPPPGGMPLFHVKRSETMVRDAKNLHLPWRAAWVDQFVSPVPASHGPRCRSSTCVSVFKGLQDADCSAGRPGSPPGWAFGFPTEGGRSCRCE